jgi:hypothetical protein
MSATEDAQTDIASTVRTAGHLLKLSPLNVCSLLCAHRPFCATFLNFIGYALGAVRVSALSNMGIVYVMTHDSIGLGKR